MYTSQQPYKALPSSTRSSRRVSANQNGQSARPGLHHAAFKQTTTTASPSSTAPAPAAALTSFPSIATRQQQTPPPAANPNGVTLQSWARSQYQLSQVSVAKFSSSNTPNTSIPSINSSTSSNLPLNSSSSSSSSAAHQSPLKYQAQQYQYSPTAAKPPVKYAVADYFDPYQRGGTPPQGQMLAIPAPPSPVNIKQPHRPGAMAAHHQQQQQHQHTPPSPLMRAVRHSRPSTPNGPATSQQAVLCLPQSALSSSLAESPGMQARLKPRAFTAALDEPMSAKTPVAAVLQVEVGHAPQKQQQQQQRHGGNTPKGMASNGPRTPAAGGSELAHAAIRDFVEMKPTWVPKTSARPASAIITSAPAVRPIAQARTSALPPPKNTSVATAGVAALNERSELIDFIERRRAISVAVDKTPAPVPALDDNVMAGKADSISSRRSDSSERSFKRSTVRLADIGGAGGGSVSSSNNNNNNNININHSKSGTGSTGGANHVSTASELRAQKTAPWYGAALPPRLPGSQELMASRYAAGRTRSSTLVSPEPRVDTPVAHRSADALRKSPNPYARAPLSMSVGVQADIKPAVQKPSVSSRGTQTAQATIHSDEAVLDLMRQMDGLRAEHADQITAYQEQVLDLELLNQDLQTEVEQLSLRLEARAQAHENAMDDMRQRVQLARKRVDREISEVRQMHEQKCNEMADQITWLLGRSEKYRDRLVELGVSEDELLLLAADNSKAILEAKASGDLPIEQQAVVDSAFIERQYMETRESLQEADYFRKLMDIERSMENTTMALGFELKRTQAKYLQQAADFIREQMARMQVENNRAESRLAGARAPSVSLKSPVAVTSGAASMYTASKAAVETVPEEDAKEEIVAASPSDVSVSTSTSASTDNSDSAPRLPAVEPLSPVLSLAASLAQMTDQFM
ncbi:hypothetical protein GGI07_001912 [Coemansia sp. Benny D115]|nr:hypothetical protein GGI07_001912 [Coemansia sp. Benny D115]